MKELLIGNAAIARGAYEAGATVATAYPGTPSTEITEFVAKYPEIYAEWSPNEKVALEVGVGASIAGARSLVCMKHVGVNVAADPLFTAAYTGVRGGLVIVVADDPGMPSSQNEQDSRFYARASHVPMLEPADSEECKEFVKRAFGLSEQYDTPVFVRLTARVAHSQSFVELTERDERGLIPYEKDIAKYVMVPANARGRHLAVIERMERLCRDVEALDFNREEARGELGVVCAGAVYQYVREALPEASVFKLGMVYPLPVERLRAFAKIVRRLVVIEELEPFFENQLKAHGIACEGKNLFPPAFDFSANLIREKLCGASAPRPEENLPARPPVMCAGCPHRGIFYLLAKHKLTVTGDIGCYSLGAAAPLCAMDAIVCMGASVGMAHGFEKALGREQSKKTVAVIGDSTFVHSGITGLVNAVYNKSNITIIILDNSTTGMTGHQENPATGKTIRRETTHKLDLYDLCLACGADSVRVTDAYDLAYSEQVLLEELNRDGVSVIIAQKPCALLDKSEKTPYLVTDKCKNCKACLKLGCPAIVAGKDRVTIDFAQCSGCGVCTQVCRFGAIEREVR